MLDLGIAATPTVARAVAWEGADAGVAVTASHNPPPDNGLKRWQPSGQAFDAALRERIAERVEAGVDDLAAWDAFGRRVAVDARSRHRDAIVDAVDPARPLDVVVDLGNGAGDVTLDVLAAMDCVGRTLNAQPDGRFPGRPGEPTPEHCTEMAALVGNSEADLGLAHDGDADRLRAVAGDGTFLSGDVLLSIFALAAAEPGDRVAIPVDTSLAVEDVLAGAGIDVERTPVGDVHVAAAAAEPGVAFGGEPSGAWIWPAETRCPDGPLAAAKLVELAAARPLAERAAAIPSYPIRRDGLETDEKAAVMERVRAAVAVEFESVSTLDGVRVDLGDAWFLIRASGTQPLVRITAEARDSDRAAAAFERARSLLEDAL